MVSHVIYLDSTHTYSNFSLKDTDWIKMLAFGVYSRGSLSSSLRKVFFLLTPAPSPVRPSSRICSRSRCLHARIKRHRPDPPVWWSSCTRVARLGRRRPPTAPLHDTRIRLPARRPIGKPPSQLRRPRRGWGAKTAPPPPSPSAARHSPAGPSSAA